jgi:hypothetical protein
LTTVVEHLISQDELAIDRAARDNEVSCNIFADTFGQNIASCGNKPPHYLHIDYYCKDGN